jgi:E3 ubiquitin-protein ligase TRIP12
MVVAKAIKDNRILDIPFSKAFYKLILGQVSLVLHLQYDFFKRTSSI